MAILLISSCPVIEKLCDQPAEACHGATKVEATVKLPFSERKKFGSKNFVPESFIAA